MLYLKYWIYRIQQKKTEIAIKNLRNYQKALKRLEVIFDAAIGSQESDEADIHGLLIDDFEKKHYPIEVPDPIEAIKIRMEEM